MWRKFGWSEMCDRYVRCDRSKRCCTRGRSGRLVYVDGATGAKDLVGLGGKTGTKLLEGVGGVREQRSMLGQRRVSV